MNIEKARQPNSQQVNADDLISSPKTVTVTGGTEGTVEQQVFVTLAEIPGRTYRPSKTMLKVLGALWGDETDEWVGRRMTLYRNPDIMFGREKLGGIEISHMSHINSPADVSVLVKRGQRKTFTIQPLPDAAPARDWLAELNLAGNDTAAIQALGTAAANAGAGDHILGPIRDAFKKAKEAQ